MAQDSTSVDRPGIRVTIVLCPRCDGKFPTEDTTTTECIYCERMFKVADNDFAVESVRVRVIGKYCLKDPKACMHVCGTCHKAYEARHTPPPREDEEPPVYWWQRD